jgi:hypothetical protein
MCTVCICSLSSHQPGKGRGDLFVLKLFNVAVLAWLSWKIKEISLENERSSIIYGKYSGE